MAKFDIVATTFCQAPGRTAECAGAQGCLTAPIGIAAGSTEAVAELVRRPAAVFGGAPKSY